ncbi:hypothetical protein AB205_0034940 [Aquarana catesbeiana]|uniref:Uncharacterized protein n=1 Tax=Aquarana catesbeiana TaxID=8400 RepID=A0A2G9R7M8_AQUCT|nr:hypothetical protein AB205_0034940 [Aquarana catesbeiana]
MHETPPAPDVLSSLFPALLVRHSGEEHMAETEQVSDSYTNEEEEEESPEPETSRSRRRRFKASNMSFVEMVEIVDILKKADYDGKPRSRRKWSRVCTGILGYDDPRISSGSSDLKIREHEQYRRIRRVLQKSK